MTFEEILDQAIAMLQRRGRLTYGTLKRQFQLDDAALDDLKEQLLYAYPQVVDDVGRGVVWTGETAVPSTTTPPTPRPITQEGALSQKTPPSATPSPSDAERRQLTVLFCDLVDSTPLASQLDPEDLREVVRAYQEACAKVIASFEGYIAQYLGDGLLVYFGYPLAHEDDAQRAVWAGLGIIEALGQLNTRLAQERGVRLAVRLGIHTGLVVVGKMGGGERLEQLALGETPNIAARLQGLAAPDTVVISAATQQLIQGYFTCHTLGSQTLKGVATPLQVYQVERATEVQQRFDVATVRGLTPLVGREHEVGLLRDRWAQVQADRGHIVLLSGEAGIGKSRLVQAVKDEMINATTLRIEYRCSPYHQHSALYPVITHLERVLAWGQDDAPEDRLRKLEETLRPYPLPLAEVVPLLAALLSLPLPADRYPLLTLTPQRQRQKTLEVLLTWLLALTGQQPVLFVVEDLHWIDPSTLAFLTLLVDQGPTARLLTLLTCRPEFQPPWGLRTHLTPMALQRLPQSQVEAMIARVTGGKALPPEVLQHVVSKTDGVPLFVEELTKTVLESGLLRETEGHYALTGALPLLAIPATLHDSLMARLDRLATVKTVAQLGAVLGRTFSYEVLQAVTPLDEVSLQQALARLVDTELLYQRGIPPQATYLFKHALIQDAAYQSLLKSTRQQFHQRLAYVLEAQFPETAETQPELVAHHLVEAGLTEQSVPYWYKAGQRAVERSAHVEAISHLTKGLELLKTLPETPQRLQRDVDMYIALGASLLATKGPAAPEVAQAYRRAQHLCAHLEAPHQLFPVLRGLWNYSFILAEYQTARALGEQLLALAQHAQDAAKLVAAHRALGTTLFFLGTLASAHTHFTQGIALYDPPQQRTSAFVYGEDAGVVCHSYAAWTLWCLGYPDQALAQSHEAETLAQQRAHPFSLGLALSLGAVFSQFRSEVHATQERAEAAVSLATEQEFPFWVALGSMLRGWALAHQGEAKEGIAQLTQGLRAWRAMGVEFVRSQYLALLAEAHGMQGEPEEGLTVLTEALAHTDSTGARWYEGECYRLKGELLLQLSSDNQAEAEHCFQQAMTVAQHQQAKSFELRTATCLARLWQQQGKRQQAHDLLAPVYQWFTEGFDTADLQEAKALLDALP